MNLTTRIRINQLRKKQITVTFPEDIKINFNSLYGLEKEKAVLNDIVNYVSAGGTSKVTPHFGYFIGGPVGIGKASLTYAVAKEANIPIICLDSNIFHTIESTSADSVLNLIFKTADMLKSEYGACVITFKNMQEINIVDYRDLFYAIFTKNIESSENLFIFLLTMSEEFVVPAALIENNFFATTFVLDYPTLECRKNIILDCIKKENMKIDEAVSIDRLAKDMIGETPLEIAYIIKETYLYSLRQQHSSVTQSDFSDTIMKIMAGEKKFRMTEEERKITAYHEAGHVIAGYFSNPKYELKRVEISPRTDSLGLTVQDADEDRYSYFKEDYEYHTIECLGGLCAEELIYGSHTSGVTEDLSMATVTVINMIEAFGMGESIGAMVVIPGATDSDFIKSRTNREAMDIISDLRERTKSILNEHRNHLEALTKALLEREVVFGNEIEEIFKTTSPN